MNVETCLGPPGGVIPAPEGPRTTLLWLFDQEEPGAGASAGAGASSVLSWFSARTSLLFHWQGAELELRHYITA